MSVFAAGCALCICGVASAGDLTISVQGECPGAVEFLWQGASAGRHAGLLYSDERGKITLSQPCGGTVIGLGFPGLRVVALFRTGDRGAGTAVGHANPDACGGFLQMVVADGYPCATSNIVQIPQ